MRILCFNCKSSKDYMALLKCINEHARLLPFDYIFFTPSRFFCQFAHLIDSSLTYPRISTFESKNDKSNILSYNFDSKIAGPLGMWNLLFFVQLIIILGEQMKYRNAYDEMRLANASEVNTKLEVFEYVDQTIERINHLAAQVTYDCLFSIILCKHQ